MTKKSKDELQVRYREIQDRMGELNVTAAEGKRSLTADEKVEWEALTREAELVNMELQGQMNDEELAKHREHVSKGEQLREYLRQTKEAGSKREILLWPTQTNTTTNKHLSISTHGHHGHCHNYKKLFHLFTFLKN